MSLTRCTARSVTQSIIEPVSAPRLRKEGIFQTQTRDVQQKSRTPVQSQAHRRPAAQKAPLVPAFFGGSPGKNPETGLAGWRGSVDRPSLFAPSLPTGDFTGKAAFSAIWERRRRR